MAILSLSISLKTLTLLFFHFQVLLAAQSSSFSFQNQFKGSNFESNVALFGDAKAGENGSIVQLTKEVGPSSGRAVYKQPIKLIEGNISAGRGNSASFSSYMAFSMSHEKGAGLALFVAPSELKLNVFGDGPFGFLEKAKSRIVAVAFDGTVDGVLVGVDVGRFASVRSRNVSFGNGRSNDARKLHSWIDYEASSKRLEVRLSESGDKKPVDPLISYPIDLQKMWANDTVVIGFSSSNGNSSQSCYVYSWTFKLRMFPHWVHSQPFDPASIGVEVEPVVVRKKSECVLKVLAAMIFGTAFGALGAFTVLYLWTIFGNRRPVVPVAPEDCAMNPKDFEYEQVKVVVDKAVEDDGKQ